MTDRYGPVIRQPYVVGAGKLVPEDFEARQALERIPLGEKVEVVIYRQRNPSFSALVYKTLTLVGNAMQWRARNVRGWLAIKTGRFDQVVWPPGDRLYPPAGKPQLVPHGTGPADMNQGELAAFWDDASGVIRGEIMPHVEPAAAEEIGWRIDDLRGQQ